MWEIGLPTPLSIEAPGVAWTILWVWLVYVNWSLSGLRTHLKTYK